MRSLIVLCTLCFAFVTTPVLAQKKTEDLTQSAASFVDNVAKQALDTVKKKQDGKLTEDQAKIEFRKILSNAFDLPTIGKFTMGRYWRVATEAQRKEYIHLLQTKILDKYADNILSYSGPGHQITSSNAINDTDYGVAMKINRTSDPAVDFGWRLRRFGNKFKVIDISVEGISMSVTHRSDFASVIERNGGKVEALLDALRSKHSEILKDMD